MNQTQLVEQYQRIRALTADPDSWLESSFGSDLWVDGLNVFLTVELEEFEQGLRDFCTGFVGESLSLLDVLDALHAFCLRGAALGEFELYQALAVGMTWLSLQPETNGQFFNLPVQVTNHSTALLLSPAYRAIWAQGYNAGFELVIDLDSDRPTIFRPEHGRIYQKSSWHQSGRTIRYPYMHYFHEMSHLCLFSDLYARVMQEREVEDTSAYVHMEAVITSLEEVVITELRQVGYELHLLGDSLGAFQLFPEAGEFRMQLHRGEVEGLTPHDLMVYLKRVFQLGEGDIALDESAMRDTLLENHQLSEEMFQLIDRHYGKLAFNLQHHAPWAKDAARRNRIASFREVVELLPRPEQCLQTFQASLSPETPVSQLLWYESLESPSQALRGKRKQALAWQELLHRIAEMRGYLELETGQRTGSVQAQLLALAQRLVQEPEQQLEAMRAEVIRCLADVEQEVLRNKLESVLAHPFEYLLEPQ